MTTSNSQTSPSLLGRLRQAPLDQHAWQEFVHRYCPCIYNWCRHWGLQQADAEDLTQDVLAKLAEKMQTFAYDPSRSFRGWLQTLTRHAWCDGVAQRVSPDKPIGGSHNLHGVKTLAAREDLLVQLQEVFDHELLQETLARVRLRVAPRTWEAFRLLALEGRSGTETAEQQGMKVVAVFMARSKVQKHLREEVARLERANGEDQS